uniref:Uncharacterized protein n=1 Tax=Hanusia phi TaxID=3032 RepID=A0A7S0HRX6_9CRYP
MASSHTSYSSWAQSGVPSARRPPEDWILLNRDNTWEAVVFDDTGCETVVDRCPTLSNQTWEGYVRKFDNSRLRSVCQNYKDRRVFLRNAINSLWPKLRSYDDTGLLNCHQHAYDTLQRLCNHQLTLFLSGSAGRMKRSLVKAILGIDTQHCPFSDKVTVRYRNNDSGQELENEFVVFVHFRQDLTEEEISDNSLHPSVRGHLRINGASFPFRSNSKKELVEVLGHHNEPMDCSWEDVRSSTLALVDSLEVFLGGASALVNGLEIVDGPTVKEVDIVATALKRQADGIVFVVNADEGFDWWPVRQALQYLPEGSVFLVVVSDGTEDAEVFSEARAKAAELKAPIFCVPGVNNRRAVLDRTISQMKALEGGLASFLERQAHTRSQDMIRLASRFVKFLYDQVERTGALLERQPTEVRSLQESCLPRLLELQDQHERTLRQVRLDYSRQRDEVRQLAEDHFRGLADKVPELAMHAQVSQRVGLTGAFSATTRCEFAHHVEHFLRCKLEEISERWTMDILLPQVEKKSSEVERHLGKQAHLQITEMEDIVAAVWGAAGQRDALHHAREKPNRISAISSALPFFSTRLISYWGVTNGFRSLIAVMCCNLMASYAYAFMGALGAAASSWLAIRSAGHETEKQIKQLIGEEMAKALRERAHECAESVADISMQPCKEAVDRFEVSFALELQEHRAAIDMAAMLLDSASDARAARVKRCSSFLDFLRETQRQISERQYELFQGVTPRQ